VAWAPCSDTLGLTGGVGECLTDERLSAVLRRAGSDLKILVVSGGDYGGYGGDANLITGAGLVDHVECFLKAAALAASEGMIRVNPAFWQLESLDLRENPGLHGDLVVKALSLAGIHNRPKEARLNSLLLGECCKLNFDVLLGVDSLVRHDRLIESPFDSPGVDVYGCAQCNEVTTRAGAIVCNFCDSVSCKGHVSDGEGISLCDNGTCDTYLCLAGDCAENADVNMFELADAEGDALVFMCDDCERLVCSDCYYKETDRIVNDAGEPYYRDPDERGAPAFLCCDGCDREFCNQAHTPSRCAQKRKLRDNYCFNCDRHWCEDCLHDDDVVFVRCAGKGSIVRCAGKGSSGVGISGTVTCAKKYCKQCAFLGGALQVDPHLGSAWFQPSNQYPIK
jgi:hypothetical protein